jgi:bifunctional DNase/RNase
MRPDSKKEHLIPVQVWRIYPYPDVSPPETFLVVLKGEEEKFVPISIGFPEGQYLVMAMQGVSFPRPLTHNLIHNLIDKIKGEVHQLVIHTLKDETFHAYLLVQTQGEVFYLDCRPSDGMILATLMNVPIYMTPEVMGEAGRELSGMLNIAELGDDLAAEIEASRNEAGIDEAELDESGLEEAVEVSISNIADDDVEEGGSGDDKSGTERVARIEPQAQSELDIMRAQLGRLVAEEAYEEAAKLRDEISRIEQGH